jgi:hypothetical protein
VHTSKITEAQNSGFVLCICVQRFDAIIGGESYVVGTPQVNECSA